MKTLVIVDDHEMISYGIKYWLENKSDWSVLDKATSIKNCMNVLQKTKPAVTLIDIDLGQESGFDLIPLIKEKYPYIKIVMYSMHDQSSFVVKSKELGAQGYISKSSQTEHFIDGLNAVYDGGTYLDPLLVDSVDKLKDASAILSKHEFAIFIEMLNGKSNDEISRILNIKKHSVEVYATIIYEKTFCKNRIELLEKYR